MAQYHVTLNSQGYVLDLDRYSKRIRDPFAAKQSTTSASFTAGDLRGPEQLFVLSDWSGGEGHVQHDAGDPGGWRASSGLDGFSVPGALQLGAYGSATGFATFDLFRPLAVYKGKLYVGTNLANVYTWDGANIVHALSVPAGAATCAAVYLDRLYLGNTVDGKLSSWDGTTLTAAAATAGGPIHTLATHYRQAAQYLYVGSSGAGLNGVGRAYYWDGASLSLGQFDFEEVRPYVSFVLGGRLYWVAGDSVNQRWGLYSVDDATSGGVWRTHERIDGGYGVSTAVVGEVAYIGDGAAGRIWSWDGSRLRVVRELSSGGTAYAGELLGLASWRGALWVTVVDGGSLSLLRYQPASTSGGDESWSRPVSGVGAASSAADRCQVYAGKLFVGSNKAAGGGLLYGVNPLTFGSSGTLTTGLISCGLPGVSKLFRSVTIVTSAMVSPQSVEVEYQLEDTGAWTTLGTLSTVGATTATYSFAAGTTGRQIAFRVILTGSAGAPSSPVLYELALRYVPRPTVSREWELAVILEGTAELPLVTLDGASESLTGAQLTAALWTAAGASGPVTLVDLDGVSYAVYVQDVREEMGKLSQRRGYQRLGVVKLVEAA